MRAVVHDEFGPPQEVLELRDISKPSIKDDEVLIRVRAAAANWADWSNTMGQPYVVRPLYGLRRPRSGVRGTDVAGTVEAVGERVDQLQAGDDVLGWGTGAFAEYVAGKAGNFVPKPTSISFEQAAAVPMAGLVALQAVRDIGKVQTGHKVLINGASGGIGTMTVQIAKAFGAEVTGVCSTPNVDMVGSIGADHVIDYTVEDYTESGLRYDLILDIADNHSLAANRRALTPNGTLIPNSGEGGRWFGSIGRIIKARIVSPFVSHKLRPFLSMPKREDLLALTELIDAGEVTPVIDTAYELGETPQAVGHVGTRHAQGKVVITI
ncbi:MAG: NAD(P)-dependent alcohol dehydrogenase [Acidimicrobiia bacterium]|nr:NAD(P)-dependent alcohol dehydrogenase [Acidimicrobiia bacterium]